VIEALDYSALLQTVHRRFADGLQPMKKLRGGNAGKRDNWHHRDVKCGFSSVCSYLQTEKKKQKRRGVDFKIRQ